ncbi:MAG: transcriptional regulator, partial [Campylobacterales bacterium]|nr:transcriptional regulator [Campylobacterales bacterium]
KKFLKSQQIIKDSEDNLIVRYEVNNSFEIIILVKKWLPFVKILEPLSLKYEFDNLLSNYLKNGNYKC